MGKGEALKRLLMIMEFIVFVALQMLPMAAFAADTGLHGYNVFTFHQSADESGILSLYGSQTLGRFKPSFHVQTMVEAGLVKATNPVNSRKDDLLGTVVSADVAAAVGIGEVFDVGMIVPVLLLEQPFDVNTQQRASRAAMGDLLFDAKVRVLKDRPRSIGLGIFSRLSVPTGKRELFSGWGAPTGEFRVLVDKSMGPVYAVTNLGYRIAAETQVQNRVTNASWNIADNDRLTFGVALRYSMPLQARSWDLFAGVEGETKISNVRELTTPVLVSGGVQKRFKNGLSLQSGGGAGVTHAIGAPGYRAWASLSFDGGAKQRRQHALEKVSAVPPEPIQQTILFDFDKAQLTGDAVKTLQRLASKLKQDRTMKIAITGHTDAMGSKSYNLRLGLKRAKAVAAELVHEGVEKDQLQVQSRGETTPKMSNATAQGRLENRRVELELVEKMPENNTVE